MRPGTPTVHGDTLVLADDARPRSVVVGTNAWFGWLEGATLFAFVGPSGTFTARKEPVSNGRGGLYWRAYRKRRGTLRRAYLGRSLDLTPARLAAAATALGPADGASEASRAPSPERSVGAAPGWPGFLTSLVGRERELVDLAAALRRAPPVRVLTLVGTGGVGKTRLARALAEREATGAAYPDGVAWVGLAALADARLVDRTVAAALGVSEIPGQPVRTAVRAALRPRRLLLVLDNCEHVVGACAGLVDAVLPDCPAVQVLATSREILGVAGEVAWRVPSLSLPPPTDSPGIRHLRRCGSVALFAERAAAAAPGFTLTALNAPAVVQICRQLDGIPLALELAAARVRVLPVEEIAARLRHGFRLLTGGSRTALPRHQTLHATLAWSYQLLDEPERTVLRRLAVFAGGWTLTAAEAVCAGDGIVADRVLDLLARLVDKSLVEVDAPAGEGRYRLLETVRQYGWERLFEAGEAEATRDRHLAWCLALAERADPGLRGAEQLAWLARLEVEHDNLRSALAWCLDREPPVALRLASALWQFWRLHGHNAEGRGLLERVLAATDEPSVPRVRALNAVAVFATAEGDWSTGRARSEESLALARVAADDYFTAWTLRDLGFLAHFQGDYRSARAWQEEGVALCRAVGDLRGLGAGLYSLSWLSAAAGDYRRARALGEESVAALRAVGDRWQVCRALWILGGVAVVTGDPDRAGALLHEGLREAGTVGSAQMSSWIRCGLGDLASWRGDLDGAADEYGLGLAHAREAGDTVGVARSLTGLGLVRCRQGQPVRALADLEEGIGLYRRLGSRPGVASALCALGQLAASERRAGRAHALLRESLALRRELEEKPGIAECFDLLAAVAVQSGRQQDARSAARLLGAADAAREAMEAPLPPGEQPRRTATARAASARLGRSAFGAAWTSGKALALDQALAEALAGAPAQGSSGETARPRLAGAASRLTAREREVAVLVARGLTNAQIAASLSISPRTVDRHVANVFDGLGLSARTQVAAWVGQHGWLD
jgi:predicted ATPase/DNA-binding CsgD family transcriptional regulator